MKHCNRCKQERATSFFTAYPRSPDGLSIWCKECKSTYDKERRLSKLEEIRKYDRDRYQRDKPKRQAMMAKRYREVAETRKQKTREYKKTEAGKLVVEKSARKRRAIKAGAFVEDVLLSELLKLYGDRCWYCQTELDIVHLEHKTPLSRGGSHSYENCVPSCPECNLSKGTLTEEEFLVRRSK